MSETLLALAGAAVAGAVRELLAWYDRRQRRRGAKRTRSRDRNRSR